MIPASRGCRISVVVSYKRAACAATMATRRPLRLSVFARLHLRLRFLCAMSPTPFLPTAPFPSSPLATASATLGTVSAKQLVWQTTVYLVVVLGTVTCHSDNML